MSQCSCGGEAIGKTLVRTKLHLELELDECRTCGRVGMEVLLMHGEVILRGYQARDAFATIDEDRASKLWETYQREVADSHKTTCNPWSAP